MSLCSKRNIRLIYASSASTCGNGTYGFEDKEDINYLKKLRSLNVYGWTKSQIDLRNVYARNIHNIAPPQWVGLKFFNVYGNNEYHKKI